MQRFLLSSILFVSGSLVTPAFADDAPSAADIKRAAADYDLGRERFREEQYTEAAEKFESADDAAPSAAALRLAIFARKEAGQIDRALTHAALALDLYPENEELRAEAQAVIDEGGAGFARVRVTCDQPCELVLNSRIVHGKAATARLLFVGPGETTILASWSEGRNQSESVSAQAGAEEELSFFAPEIPVASPESNSNGESTSESGNDSGVEDGSKGGWSPAIFWTGLTLTAVGGGASVALGLNAKNNPGVDVVKKECEPNDKSCPEYQEGVKNQTMANVAIGATAAFGVFTIVSAFMTDWGGGDDGVAYHKGDLSVRPTFSVGAGASLGATGTF